MDLYRAEPSDAEELVEDLWLPLAKEMEQVSDYNELAEGDVRERSVDYRRERLSEEGYTSFILSVEGEKAGFVTVHEREHPPVFAKGTSGEISELYVREEFRRKGYAGKLIEKAVEWCRSRGLEAVELSVDRDNEKAMKLYRENGFREVRKRMRREDL
jgi:ribosomal protein S18 acetylase RimI-like enzyme